MIVNFFGVFFEVMTLNAPEAGQRRRLGFMAGQITVLDDFDRRPCWRLALKCQGSAAIDTEMNYVSTQFLRSAGYKSHNRTTATTWPTCATLS